MARLTSVLALPGQRPGARLVAWLKREGDRLARGEPVLEVELEDGREAVALDGDGTLLRRLAVAGDWLTPDLAVAIVGAEGEDIGALATGPAEAEPAPADEAGGPGTALAVLPPRRLARPMGPADHVDRPLSPRGQRAAARAAAARRDVPRGYAEADADATELLAYCDRLNRMLGSRGELRPFDLVLKAAAVALRRVPQINATYLGDAIRFYTSIHIGIACPAGAELAVPRILDADLKNLADLGEEARALEGSARRGEIGREELRRVALAVCDLGALGIDRADLLAARADTAVLTVGRLRREPVVLGSAVAIGHRLPLAISCDERVAGGTAAARFLGEVVAIVERPDLLASV